MDRPRIAPNLTNYTNFAGTWQLSFLLPFVQFEQFVQFVVFLVAVRKS